METYGERMSLPLEPGEALAACAHALASHGFDSIEMNTHARMITATRTNVKLRENRVVVLVEAVPAGSLITVRGAARRIASLFSSPAQNAVREAIRTSRKRRPWNGRDFYVSFGDGSSRRWEDARRYGFIAGGGNPWYSRTLDALEPGHRVFAYVPQTGYVGVGEVTESAQAVKDFTVEENGKMVPLLQAEHRSRRRWTAKSITSRAASRWFG
jgi:hypothetical protein